MASNPVGTMYVELSLDATKYTKAQKDILAGAEKNSADINKVFKTVGTQSDEMYNAMRKNIQNSLNAIKQSHLSSADEIRRAQESAAAKIKTINEQQYGHQTGIIEKLKANWIAAAAAIGAAMVIASKAYSMAKLGAELEETRGILNNMARQYKLTADDIVASMARASKGLIANSDLMQVALGGLSKGLNPEQLINLSKAADTLGDSIGVTATQALTDLTQALESGRVKGLKNFAGSTIDLKDAFGDLASKMSAAEKTQAMYALIMIHTTELQKKQTEAVNDAADKFESMEAKYKNYADTFSVVMMKMTVRLGDYLVAIGKAAQKTAQFFGLADLPSGASRDFSEPKDEIAQYKKIISDLKASLAKKDGSEKGLKEAETATKAVLEATRKAAYELEAVGQSQYEKDMARIKSEAEQYRKSGVNKIAIAKWVAAETALADAKNTNEKFKQWNAESDKAISAMQTEADAGVKLTEERIKDREKLNEFAKENSDNLLSVEDHAIEDLIDKEKKKYDYLAKLEADGVITHKEAEEEKRKLTEKRIKSEKEIESEKWIKANAEQQQVFSNLATCFDTASQLYAEDSKERQALSEAAKIATMAEIALQVQKNIMIAVGAVVNQGTGDPYTAFARIAAMIAVVTGVLSMAGIAFGGSSSASAPAPKTYNKGGDKGPLGAETGTASKSLENSLEKMEDVMDNIFNVEDVKLTKIHNELKDLNGNITGLVASIFRTGLGEDYSSFGMTEGTFSDGTVYGNPLQGGFVGFSNMDMKDLGKDAKQFFSSATQIFFDTAFIAMGDWLSFGIGSNRITENIANALFGGDTEVSLQKGGVEFGDVLVRSVISGMGISARQFALYKIEEDGGWFHSDSTSWKTKYAALNNNVAGLFTKMFESLGITLVTLAEGLGSDIEAAKNYIFKGDQLNLKDLNPEEMTEAITTYFTDMADQAASDLFGTIISRYQQLNEALYETAIRLIADKETVMNILSATGHGMEEFTTRITKTRQVITDEWTKWDAARVKYESQSHWGVWSKYYKPEPEKYRTETYQEIKTNIPDLIELSQKLIEIAGGLDKLVDAAENFYGAFYNDYEKNILLQGQLTGAFVEMGMVLPKTRDGFKDLVNGIDLTTQAGKEAYVSLLNMSEYADQYYSYLEDLASERNDMEIELLELQGNSVAALSKERTAELKETDQQLRSLQRLIYAQQDLNDLLDKSKEILDQWHSMESELLSLQGDEVGSLVLERQAELDALDESLRPLQKLIYAQEDLNSARDNEIKALEKVISATEKAMSEQGASIDQLQGYISKLKSARESMKLEGMKFSSDQAYAARFAFQAVLDKARSGDFSGLKDVDNSLKDLTSYANTPKAFRTKQEYESNYYKTYNDIAELEKLTGTQLSTEEQTLNTLKEQLKVLNQIAGNTDDSELSVQDAQVAYDAAHADSIAKQAALESAKAQYDATRQAFVTMEEVVNSINGNNSQLTMSISEMTTALLEAKQAVVDATAGWATYQANQTAADAAAEQARLDALSAKQAAEAQAAADALLAKQIADAKAAADALAKQQAAQQAAAAEAERRASDPLYDLRQSFREWFAPIANLFTNYGDVPGFASGGTFAGGYRVVGENGPELEYTGPSQITSNASSKALLDNSEVVKELKSLREDIKAYGYAIAKNTGKSAKVSDRWDIDGLPAERTIT